MRRLDTSQTRAANYFSRVRHAVITSVSSLLIWTKMLISVGFVIIGVVILGVLLDVLVRLHNYRNGTKLQTGPILKGLLIFLLNQSILRARQNSNYRKNL